MRGSVSSNDCTLCHLSTLSRCTDRVNKPSPVPPYRFFHSTFCVLHGFSYLESTSQLTSNQVITTETCMNRSPNREGITDQAIDERSVSVTCHTFPLRCQ